MTTQEMTTPKADLETTLIKAVRPYGKDVQLVSIGTDRFTQPAPFMVPCPTLIQIQPDPDVGDVFKVGSKMIKGNWTDVLSLSAPTLKRICHAAGIKWLPRLCRVAKLERNYICFEAVGTMRMPDGSMQTVTGTREIDFEILEEESRMLQARKLWKQQELERRGKKYGQLSKPDQRALDEEAKGVDYEDFEADDRRRIDRAVKMELIELKKHKVARAETGAKKRAIADLGIRSTYTAEDLQRPFLFVRWSVEDPQRSEWEMRALWSGQQPDDPELGPAPPSIAITDEEFEDVLAHEEAEYADVPEDAAESNAPATQAPPESNQGVEGEEDEDRPQDTVIVGSDLVDKKTGEVLGPASLEDDEISEEALAGAKEQEPDELIKMIEATEKSLGLAAAGAKRLRTYWAKSHSLKNADRSDLQQYFAHLVHLEDRQLQLTPQQ